MSVAVLLGIGLGIFAGVIPGQFIAGLFLNSLGARGFRFIINPAYVFALAPALTIITAFAATVIGLLEIKTIRAFECLR